MQLFLLNNWVAGVSCISNVTNFYGLRKDRQIKLTCKGAELLAVKNFSNQLPVEWQILMPEKVLYPGCAGKHLFLFAIPSSGLPCENTIMHVRNIKIIMSIYSLLDSQKFFCNPLFLLAFLAYQNIFWSRPGFLSNLLTLFLTTKNEEPGTLNSQDFLHKTSLCRFKN